MTTAQIHGSIPNWHMGDRLRKAREQVGLDQQQLADTIGVSRRTVGNAESGKHAVRKIVLNAWSLATGVPLVWLETDESPHPAGPNGGECAVRDLNPEPAD